MTNLKMALILLYLIIGYAKSVDSKDWSKMVFWLPNLIIKLLAE
jgi:hypothetical protein